MVYSSINMYEAAQFQVHQILPSLVRKTLIEYSAFITYVHRSFPFKALLQLN